MGRSLVDSNLDPMGQFEDWFKDACRAEIPEPSGGILATAGGDGRPSARVVLLKAFDQTGFVFFTNYESRKSREIGENPFAALTFWWEPLGRQVRIRGQTEKLTEADSNAYFATRPRGSQIGAWVSPQSRPIADLSVLVHRATDLTAELDGAEVPRPPFWGGFKVVPFEIEFWSRGEDRLHHRRLYSRNEKGEWRSEWLAP